MENEQKELLTKSCINILTTLKTRLRMLEEQREQAKTLDGEILGTLNAISKYEHMLIELQEGE